MDDQKQKKKLFLTSVFVFGLLLFFSSAHGVLAANSGRLIVNWTPPTKNADGSDLTDLAGYIVYYGTTSHSGTCPAVFGSAGPYDSSVTVANPAATSQEITGLTENQTYYFAVIAYNASDNMSGCATTSGSSTEVSKKARYQADFDENGSVGLGDWSAFHVNYGMSSGATFADGDADGDGKVGLSDWSIFHGEYGDSIN
ncbi:MAG: fibronectin type III domain-containing protein [Candidatus Pacebacteria bacterium]|nr:fibronectin type III domain-containing protein [Candidatus Paceibacterota bacterium]MDR3582910.1 fibronectin type III domain-containing protein [Candidatus Paceibacterota bacterium]